MKILMTLSNPFSPDARVYSEALSLIEEGHEVTLIAWDREANYPIEEDVDGIHIVRIRVYLPQKSVFLHFFKLWSFWNKAYKKALNLDFDVIHAHDLDTLPLGIKLKKRFNKSLIFDAHDIYPYIIAYVVPGFVVKLAEGKERKWLKYVDRLITDCEGFKDYYIRAGVDPTRIAVVMNCKEHKEIPEDKIKSLRKSLGAEDKFVIMYIGALEGRRFIEELLKACDQLDDDMLLVIGGFGDLYDYVENAVEKCTKGNVKFIGFVHPNAVIAYTKCADVIFGMYHPDEKNSILTMPVKVLDSMIAGVPIIINRELNARKLVVDNEFGLSIPYEVSAFFNAVKELKSNPELRKRMGENAQRLGREEYNWDVMSKRLKELYKEIEGTISSHL